MPLSIAPRDSVVSTDLPALPPVSTHRLPRFATAVRSLLRPSVAAACPYCQAGGDVVPHPDMTYLDALAREYPYLYTMAFYH
jgi:hypothetical protein